MGSMMKNMTIGPKFILSISMTALLVITAWLVTLYQQEESKMDTMLNGMAAACAMPRVGDVLSLPPACLAARTLETNSF